MDKKKIIGYIIVGLSSYCLGVFSTDLVKILNLTNNNYLTFEASKNQEDFFTI